MIFITKADISDAAAIASLGKITFTETFGDLFTKQELEDYLVKTFNFEKILNSLKKQNNKYWIAFNDDNPVGYAKIKLYSNIVGMGNIEQIQLQKIYILKAYLNIKIGSALLKEIMASKELKTGSLVWLVVLSTNERAIRFYEKSGFTKFKKHYHQIGKTNFEYELMIREI
jgi:ribosomal protein S18 acetylase RimI-like enzyme